jgi:hypothetical protein
MKALNNWTVDHNVVVPSPTVAIFVADAVDANGRVWPGLASMVRVVGPNHHDKVFVGESAWSDAERYALDAALRN